MKFEKNRRICVECVNARHRNYYKKNKQEILLKYKTEEKRKLNRISCSKWYKKNKSKKLSSVRKRQTIKLDRTPKWLTKADFIELDWAYKLAAEKTKETGIKHVVDHIIPLRGKHISGLHCPQNIQLITASENLKKGNTFPYKRSI